MKKTIIVILCAIAAFLIIDFGTSKVLKKGLDNYFGFNQNAGILLVGHSHLMLATDKKMLEDSLHAKVSKYCREGVDVATRDVMIKHYLSLPDKDSLKTVIYGVDQYMFNPKGLSENVYKLFYPFMDNKEIDRYIKDNASPKDYWVHKTTRLTGYTDALINSAIRGWQDNWSNYKSGTIDINKIRSGEKGKQLRPIVVDEKLKKIFESSLKALTDKDITVVLLNTPIIKEYNDYQPQQRKDIIDYFQKLAESSDMIYYWDLNPDYSERYELFYDPIHINNTGQPIITREIINRYKEEFQK